MNMSEEKKPDNWSRLQKMMNENNKNLLAQVEQMIGSGKSEEKHEHWHAEDILNTDCPECKKEVEKIGQQFLRKQKDLSHETHPVICKDCGTIVQENTEECPTCKNRNLSWR